MLYVCVGGVGYRREEGGVDGGESREGKSGRRGEYEGCERGDSGLAYKDEPTARLHSSREPSPRGVVQWWSRGQVAARGDGRGEVEGGEGEALVCVRGGISPPSGPW